MKTITKIITIYDDGTIDAHLPPKVPAPAKVLTLSRPRPCMVGGKTYKSVHEAYLETGYSRYHIMARCASKDWPDWALL